MTDERAGLPQHNTKCPACGSDDYAEADGEHTFPVGDDFDAATGIPATAVELTVRVPIGECKVCSGSFLDYRSEYVTEAAAKTWRETRRAALAQPAGVVRPLVWESYGAPIPAEEKDRIRKTDLYQRGDTICIWINEGDLYNLAALSAGSGGEGER